MLFQNNCHPLESPSSWVYFLKIEALVLTIKPAIAHVHLDLDQFHQENDASLKALKCPYLLV